jgi:hypothetical protein
MSEKRYFTRLDVFANIDEVIKFQEFARARGAKTRKDMVAALEAYKKADLIVEEHKERVEAHLAKAYRLGLFKPKGEPKCEE